MTNGNREVFLAADLGASSGRLVAGGFDGNRIRLEDVHRFENGGVEVADHLYWDFLDLWKQLETGLSQAATQYQDSVISLGVDTWGVDFGLLDSNDQLLANPRHYRDQSQEILETAFGIVPREEIFEQTGLQFMEFNSLYQLLSLKQENSQLFDSAACLLMIPDLSTGSCPVKKYASSPMQQPPRCSIHVQETGLFPCSIVFHSPAESCSQ